jgi:endonuclease/exonuclease/phosphatase family metal-dependent hydrolase
MNTMRAFLLLLCLTVHALAAETPLRVMTFNLRYASDRPPNAWSARRPVVKELLEKSRPDIFGTQEGLYQQLKDIAADLPRYHWIGLGRDGGSHGEFMAIFYDHERFDPLEYDHFWLSDTPNVVASTTWGNSNRRMVTWIKFRDQKNDKTFYVFNTHFDHQIQIAREKAAALLRERIAEIKMNAPIIVIGDFNATAGKNRAYDLLTEGDFLKDTWKIAGERREPIVRTFHNFGGPQAGDDRIDWILVRGPVKATWTQIDTFSANGQFPSDHFPVTAELVFGAN